jgi:hypothetical protein
MNGSVIALVSLGFIGLAINNNKTEKSASIVDSKYGKLPRDDAPVTVGGKGGAAIVTTAEKSIYGNVISNLKNDPSVIRLQNQLKSETLTEKSEYVRGGGYARKIPQPLSGSKVNEDHSFIASTQTSDDKTTTVSNNIKEAKQNVYDDRLKPFIFEYSMPYVNSDTVELTKSMRDDNIKKQSDNTIPYRVSEKDLLKNSANARFKKYDELYAGSIQKKPEYTVDVLTNSNLMLNNAKIASKRNDYDSTGSYSVSNNLKIQTIMNQTNYQTTK